MIEDFFNLIKGDNNSNKVLINGYKIYMLKGMIDKDKKIYIKTHNTFENCIFRINSIKLQDENIYFYSKNGLDFFRIQAHFNAEVLIKEDSIIFEYFL